MYTSCGNGYVLPFLYNAYMVCVGIRFTNSKDDSTEAEEEELRSHFASCGDIESVRIVRDKKLASGKGFGYVNFMVSFVFPYSYVPVYFRC